jgi:hypothetical protein
MISTLIATTDGFTRATTSAILGSVVGGTPEVGVAIVKPGWIGAGDVAGFGVD